MKKYKKILIVTHQYLPHVSPRTTRWKLLVDELIANGHNVSILTGMYPDFDTNNVEILYFGNKNNINIVSNLREKSKQVASADAIKKIFYGVLKKIYRFLSTILLGLIIQCFGFIKFTKIEIKFRRITIS